MTQGLRRHRFRAGAVVALLALVAVLWLNVAPHRHADAWSEKHCAACQVLRGDGPTAPVGRAVDLVRPPSVSLARATTVAPAPDESARHGGPPPGRSPPALAS